MKQTFAIIALLILAGLAFGQPVKTQVIQPWAGPDTVRHLYILAGQPQTFTSGGQASLGYAVLKYSTTRGTIEWIGSRIFRWKTIEGRSEIYHAGPMDQGFISDTPLPLFVCEAGSCKGWVFVRPPFQGVTVLPPQPAPPPPPLPAPVPVPAPAPAPAPAPPVPVKPPTPAAPVPHLETRRPGPYYTPVSPQQYSVYAIYPKGK